MSILFQHNFQTQLFTDEDKISTFLMKCTNTFLWQKPIPEKKKNTFYNTVVKYTMKVSVMTVLILQHIS